MVIELSVALFRILLTFVASFIFGIERQKEYKPIGFGTFIFVAVGSCGLSIAALNLVPDNPLPLLGAIVTGIGFLGAGALIKSGDKVYGFTSGSTIWLFAIFGVIMGIGEYPIALTIYVLVGIVTIYDNYLEKMGRGYHNKILKISFDSANKNDIEPIVKSNTTAYRLISVSVDGKSGKTEYVYSIEGKAELISKIPNKLVNKQLCDSSLVE